jgi:hypothetical protein
MAGEPTLRLGDQSVDGWVEYLQEQLVNHHAWIAGLPDLSWAPTGVFDDETEHYVRVFQRGAGIHVDGIVGDETWNMLHGMADNVDPQTDGRQPHTYVEQSPRLEWENDAVHDDARTTWRYAAINVGSTPVSGVVATVEAFGDVGVTSSTATGYTLDGEPAAPGERLYFEVTLERALTSGELVSLSVTLPSENGGASFQPGISG